MKKIKNFRSFFPIFQKHPELIYFDTAATSLKPYKMIEALTDFYHNNGLSIRSSNPLNLENNKILERTRQKTAFFLKSQPEEIIFTKGATDSLNIIAQSLSSSISSQDEIIVSSLEHNSSFLPWMEIANQKKAKLVFIPLDSQYQIQIDNFKEVLTHRTKIIVLTHVSNVLGHINPIREITALAHKTKALVILDASQSAAHIPLNVGDLDVDFMTFSAHKVYGPFGLGILFGKNKFLKKLRPPFVGSGSIQEIDIQKNNFLFRDSPYKWLAGTPSIANIIAWEKSLEFIEEIGLTQIFEYEKKIAQYLFNKLSQIPKIKIFTSQITNIINFNFINLHSHDIEHFLIQDNIYVRTGQFCSQLTLEQMREISTIRASVGIHNNKNDVDLLINSLYKAYNFFYFDK
ncbi:aminotransferase class V-fold PLP-dependent enzyme [Columbia Basin potato purple top phytoplasma]|uniref:cysteine desulfurase n=1 Tax=Columbia Basin potato purple top phytoplasma TaxID=307134 RepID=A0ABT5L920_9MOLU|nr:aminotransferase class V-fold PLP-dependent enzyme [Columbia Basin potato purple top phytoplasma]MDC9032100.1 cysteine desulfurase [Columbia Basin potato purple top phytoplasma]